jgi:hypothetical protein
MPSPENPREIASILRTAIAFWQNELANPDLDPDERRSIEADLVRMRRELAAVEAGQATQVRVREPTRKAYPPVMPVAPHQPSSRAAWTAAFATLGAGLGLPAEMRTPVQPSLFEPAPRAQPGPAVQTIPAAARAQAYQPARTSWMDALRPQGGGFTATDYAGFLSGMLNDPLSTPSDRMAAAKQLYELYKPAPSETDPWALADFRTAWEAWAQEMNQRAALARANQQMELLPWRLPTGAQYIPGMEPGGWFQEAMRRAGLPYNPANWRGSPVTLPGIPGGTVPQWAKSLWGE